MKNACTVGAIAFGALLAIACGSEDEKKTVVGDASVAPDAAFARDSATGSDAADASGGCASGARCPEGLQCCSGVPYAAEGECLAVCDMKSDRAAKQDVTRIDEDAILAKLSALPIRQWSYRGDPSVRHVGPMAQDFHAAFGVGGDRTIHGVDANGVTIAAIQALHRRVEALEAENARLRARR